MKFKVALAQTDSSLGNIEKNVKKHLAYCKSAIKKKAELIVFPELSLTGYSLKDMNYEAAINPYTSEFLEPLKKVSRNISIVCGGVEEDDTNAVFNSAFYIDDGKVKFTHRKIFPPDYGMFEEMRYFSKGRKVNVHYTKFGKIGILVCEDLWHISLPLILALKGAKLIITIAVSPTRLDLNPAKGKKAVLRNYEINSEHHKSYARLLSSYIVFCNRVGYEDGVNFWGGSEAVDPFGNVIAAAKFFDEDMILADIDFDVVKHARHQARHFLDEDIDFLKEQTRILNDEILKL